MSQANMDPLDDPNTTLTIEQAHRIAHFYRVANELDQIATNAEGHRLVLRAVATVVDHQANSYTRRWSDETTAREILDPWHHQPPLGRCPVCQRAMPNDKAYCTWACQSVALAQPGIDRHSPHPTEPKART